MAGPAMQDLFDQMHVKVNAGDLSMADAKDMLTGAVNAMNAQSAKTNAAANAVTAQTGQQTQIANAAKSVLDTTSTNASTGAGLINQRVSAGQGMLSSILGLAGQRPMVGLPGNIGQMLAGDVTGLTAQLGGGQDVYDTAARLVKAADPQGGGSPMAQTAFGVISQMLQRYQQDNNQPHPLVAATQAAAQSQQAGGMTAPFNPQASTAGLNAAGYQDTPAGRVAAQAANPTLLQTPAGAVPAVQPVAAVPAVQQGWTAPGANYMYAGAAPWNAQPGPAFPGFVAPGAAPTLVPVQPLAVSA
jgi:hypothetical protein